MLGRHTHTHIAMRVLLDEGCFVSCPDRYCLADDRLLEAVKFLDLGNGAGWELLQVSNVNLEKQKWPVFL